MTGDPRLSPDAARRIALAAQGFAEPRPSPPAGAGQVQAAIERIGQLQLDSVNVLCRAHYLPVFARVGPYPRRLLDEMAWGSAGSGGRGEGGRGSRGGAESGGGAGPGAGGGRRLFEYWGHQAALLPLGTHRLLRWRMQAAQRWDWTAWPSPGAPAMPPADWRTSLDPALHLAPWAVISGMTRIAAEQPQLVASVLAEVAAHGPVAAAQASPDHRRHGEGQDVGTGRLWNWHDAKIALEWLFYAGQVTTAARRGFQRLYDLTERVLPPEILHAPAPAQDDAQRGLMRIAARALGVATEKELRQYFHLPAAHARTRIAELVDAGELTRVRVGDLPPPMYLWSRAAAPAAVAARALLSPFDSLIWDRDRTLRLFGFHYRISIYTPAARRARGYYVLPFLLGDRLVARVDLRADREHSTLAADHAYAEPGADPREVAPALAAELRLMAGWLELENVKVGAEGDLAATVRQAVQ